MVGENSKDIKTIFAEALEKPSIEECNAYVKQACDGDSKLRSRVEALLKSHKQAGGFFQKPAISPAITVDDAPISEGPGTIIGRYKLLEKIGEGGMAVVYMAEQEVPIRRRVALKIIKLGMDTKSVIARFEAERQALAMMDHPNIAKVLDAGATETGRPYFVMELVTGVSITDYCDKNNLSTKGRLALFIQVCNAVQHAHQKGIIHRDIKPTNVMVTHHNGKPVPKIIDFGIAKAINQKLTEKTLFTRYAHIIGTPAYMSPEQAELSDLDIDTRSDIYSLGVLLYELLTGTTPFSEEELRKAGYIEMQRIIREQDPPKPSTKLSTLGKTLTDIAKYRNSTPDLLTKTIRGDLDWIVMKSLEKDRTRRYETANMLALDIRHHLENEPVMAGAPGSAYRMQKFLRRHRSQTVATFVFLVIASAVAIILSMWNRDRLQLDEAEGFRDRGILSQAREQYAKADRETALETLKPILDSKHVGPEAQLLYAGIFVDNRRSDEAMTVLNNLLDEPPEIAGAAHSLLARILWESESPNAEKLKEIEEHRRKAEELLPETAEAYYLRAMTSITVKEQFASLDRALQLDPAHYESRRLRAFTYYASRKYDKMRDDALVMEVLRPRDPLGCSLRAIALRELGKYEEAIAEYDKAIALTPKGDAQYIDLSSQRCETLLRMGDYERVVSDAEECLKISPDKTVFQYQIFCSLTALGEYDKATTPFRQIISHGHEARQQFRHWCAKYVFDTLDAGRSWHLQDHEPFGAAFLPMVEAEETYRELSAKAQRLTLDGFSARWSPDGKKLAFSAGVHGYSGIAVFDPATKETELLIVPGKDPRWSPDGKYIAFVRDCQLLRLEELAKAENNRQQRPVEDEEVWLMKSDGTEPKLLAKGSWPSWGRDSEHIYYQSRVDNFLFLVSIVDPNTEPKKIIKCSYSLVSVSPDSQRVSYFEAGKLKIKDLASKKIIIECPVPSMSWGVTGWSTTRNEVCIGGSNQSREKNDLWVYDLDKNELLSVLNGQIHNACWSSKGTKLALSIGLPYFEIWTADLDPNVSTIEALGPAQTVDEHIRETLDFYSRRIETDPADAHNYLHRAGQFHYLREKAKVRADMRRYYTILSQRPSSDFAIDILQKPRRVINGPFGYQAVFTVERRENNIQVPCIALGRKGRCNMKSFQMPTLSTHGVAMSLLGLCLLSGMDTPPVIASFTFGTPTNLGPTVNSSAIEAGQSLSVDGLSLCFSSNRPGGYGGYDLWMTQRLSKDSPWAEPVNLGPVVNSSAGEVAPCLSADGLSLYFCDWPSARPGGCGGEDLWVTTRETINDEWGIPINLGLAVNSSSDDWSPNLSTDGLSLFFDSNRPGGQGDYDLWMIQRPSKDAPWAVPVNLGPTVNSSSLDVAPSLSADGLILLFTSERPGGLGDWDVWFTRRKTIQAEWTEPVNLGPTVNTWGPDGMPNISADGSVIYFYSTCSGGYGGYDLWQVPIEPVVDFNSDGIVDAADVCIMIEHWYTDNPLCDIGPFPWGDGIVDVQDLIVLAEHLFEEIPPAEEVE